jgi:hypothetical protein
VRFREVENRKEEREERQRAEVRGPVFALRATPRQAEVGDRRSEDKKIRR